jgi:hypothetical protein
METMGGGCVATQSETAWRTEKSGRDGQALFIRVDVVAPQT